MIAYNFYWRIPTKDEFWNKFRFLDGSRLKIIVSLLMLANHSANAFSPIVGRINITTGLFSINLVKLIYYISRICFPIYAFLITEGFMHTHNRKQYGWNLFLFALISEIPWNLEHTGSLYYDKQNVLFTLLFGYLGLCAIEKYRNETPKQFAILLVLMITAIVFKSDYGVSGFSFILLLYALRNDKVLQAIIGCAILST